MRNKKPFCLLKYTLLIDITYNCMFFQIVQNKSNSIQFTNSQNIQITRHTITLLLISLCGAQLGNETMLTFTKFPGPVSEQVHSYNMPFFILLFFAKPLLLPCVLLKAEDTRNYYCDRSCPMMALSGMAGPS